VSGFTIAVAAAECVNGEQRAALTVQVRLLKLMPLYMQWIATVTGLQDQTVDQINRPLFSLFCCPALWSRQAARRTEADG